MEAKSEFSQAWPLAPQDVTVLTLTEMERQIVRQAIERLPALHHPNDIDDEALTSIEVLQRALPERIASALIEFRRSPNRAGTLIVRNLPTDPVLPATPEDGRPPRDKLTSYSEYCLLITMLYLGEPIAYMDEKAGTLIQNICPVRGQEEKQENTGSVYLEFHMEDGFHPFMPDYLGLVCLRSDHEVLAETVTASIRQVVQLLPSTAMTILRQPLFRLKLSSSFADGSSPAYADPMAVLSGHWLEPDMCIDYFLMEAMAPHATWALELLKSALLEKVNSHVMVPGDLLVVDNRMAAHGRTGFQPRYDGRDRWLQRMFTVRDLRKSAASRAVGGRQCSPLAVEFSLSN